MKYLLIVISCLFIQCANKITMSKQPIKIHAIRLLPNQDVRQQIEAFVNKEKITAGYIITCVGSLIQANLRFANQPNGTQLNGHFEIVSLTGTLSTNGCHLHMSISDSTGKTIGGHVLANNLVYTTAEIVIGQSNDMIFKREKDGTTPWDELQILHL